VVWSGGLNDVLGDLCFEVGDAPVQEAAGGAGGVEAFAQCAVLAGELADAVVQGGVLRGDALRGAGAEGCFEVADRSGELADPAALGQDLGVRVAEGVLGVECSFPPGGLGLPGGCG
jgi:hypothetical protein